MNKEFFHGLNIKYGFYKEEFNCENNQTVKNKILEYEKNIIEQKTKKCEKSHSYKTSNISKNVKIQKEIEKNIEIDEKIYKIRKSSFKK